MERQKRIKFRDVPDAFGNRMVPGSEVVYYTGDLARLMRGTVVDMYLGKYQTVRVKIRTDSHVANINSLLCLVEKGNYT